VISYAYSVLSDPEKRRVYDLSGDEGIQSYEQTSGKSAPATMSFLVKAWVGAAAGWTVLCLLDHFIGLPMEWIGVTIGNVFMLVRYRGAILKASAINVVADLVLWLILPSWLAARLANIVIITLAVAFLNTLVCILSSLVCTA